MNASWHSPAPAHHAAWKRLRGWRVAIVGHGVRTGKVNGPPAATDSAPVANVSRLVQVTG
jgi:hypothetical protein